MARINWLDEDTNTPALEERVHQLEHFMESIADGIIDEGELLKQNNAVVAAMEAVQDELTDEQHEKVTTVLVELMAFSIMSTLHELGSSRPQGTAEE